MGAVIQTYIPHNDGIVDDMKVVRYKMSKLKNDAVAGEISLPKF